MAYQGAMLVAEASLRQAVSPQIIARSEILELTADELWERVQEELETNPALEVAEESFPYPLSRSVPTAPAGESPDVWETVAAPQTLADDLRLQLAQVPPARRRLCEYLVDCLDERGFLDVDNEAVARRFQVTVFEVEAAILALQGLEPAGIGARNLRECLLLQVRRLPAAEVPPGTTEFIGTYLNTTRRQTPAQAAALLQLDDRQLAAILEFIAARLYMWPATHFAETTPSPAAAPVFPDAWITDQGGCLRVRVAQSWSRGLRVSEAYARLDHEWQRVTAAATTRDRELLADRVRSARAFIHHLTRREAALKQLTEAIVKRQRGFFEQGPAALTALTRKEVAAMLRVHESTISRLTRDKYVRLPDDRLVPFDYFFDGSLAAKYELQDLLADEDPAHPLSDAQLADLMQERGHVLARRTVAKYRDALGVPPAHLRKRTPKLRELATA